MDVNQKGNLTELQVMAAAIKAGCIISIPYGDCSRYDQIWDINGQLIRVQIKTARPKNREETGIIFNCYSVSNKNKHKYSKKDIDYFATYWNEQCYLIPVEECSTEKTLWFMLSQDNPRCAMAQDYLLEEILKKY